MSRIPTSLLLYDEQSVICFDPQDRSLYLLHTENGVERPFPDTASFQPQLKAAAEDHYARVLKLSGIADGPSKRTDWRFDSSPAAAVVRCHPSRDRFVQVALHPKESLTSPALTASKRLPNVLRRDFITVKVQIPKMRLGRTGDELVAFLMKISCPLDTRVNAVVKQAIVRYNSNPRVQAQIPTEMPWTLRVRGTCEFLLLERPLEAFLAVRRVIRQNRPLECCLEVNKHVIADAKRRKRNTFLRLQHEGRTSDQAGGGAAGAGAGPVGVGTTGVKGGLGETVVLGESSGGPQMSSNLVELLSECAPLIRHRTHSSPFCDHPALSVLKSAFRIRPESLTKVPSGISGERDREWRGQSVVSEGHSSVSSLLSRTAVPSSHVSSSFRVRLVSLLGSMGNSGLFKRKSAGEAVGVQESSFFVVKGEIWHGWNRLPFPSSSVSSRIAEKDLFSYDVIWDQWLVWEGLSLSSLPREAVLVLKLCALPGGLPSRSLLEASGCGFAMESPVDPFSEEATLPQAQLQAEKQSQSFGASASRQEPATPTIETVELGFTIVPLFREDKTLRLPGPELFRLWPSSEFRANHLLIRGDFLADEIPETFEEKEAKMQVQAKGEQSPGLDQSGKEKGQGSEGEKSGLSSGLLAVSSANQPLRPSPSLLVGFDVFSGAVFHNDRECSPALLHRTAPPMTVSRGRNAQSKEQAEKEAEREREKHRQEVELLESGKTADASSRLLTRSLAKDPLGTLSPDDRRLLFDKRRVYSSQSFNFYKLALAVDYTDRLQVDTLHALLKKSATTPRNQKNEDEGETPTSEQKQATDLEMGGGVRSLGLTLSVPELGVEEKGGGLDLFAESLEFGWAILDPLDAVAILDSRFADEQVRKFAVMRIAALGDDDLAMLLVQLVQALKSEPFHLSDLSSLLVERAVRSPVAVGHRLFWHLRSESHDLRYAERFCLLLEQLLIHSPAFAKDLETESEVVETFVNVAGLVKCTPKSKQVTSMRQELVVLDTRLPPQFGTSIDLARRAAGLRVEKCKVMSSKKLPLWIVFKNADREGGSINTIFKCGDDLRQDILTLQLISLIDNIWLQKGLDLRMTPYAVVGTGDMLGLIEVVTESDTTSNIQIEFGGRVAGAFSDRVILDFLKKHNPTEDSLNEATDNFVRSCAGYCVATYVLGIGDRHNGNIMVKTDGRLFHIDFGHFLGNFKSKFGIKRERAPFVFTPEMSFAMGGKKSLQFQQFVEFCCSAYNVLRGYGWQLIQLFMIMVAAEMPELTSPKDLVYLREMLSLDLTEAEARAKFEAEIKNSLETTSRRVDNFFHNIKVG